MKKQNKTKQNKTNKTNKPEEKLSPGKRVTPSRKEGNPTGRVTLLAETSKNVSCKHSILDSLEIMEKLARLGWPLEEGNPATRENFFPYKRPKEHFLMTFRESNQSPF